MPNLSGNPWNLLPADVATTAAISSIVNNKGSILVTTSAAHNIVTGQIFSIQGAVVTGWNGGYEAIAVPSTTTILANIDPSKSGLANGGAAGNVLSIIYPQLIEVTQMLWDAVAGSLLITDLTGRTIWNPTAGASGPATYMKAFPIFGLVLNTMATGILQISV
jgi:hypothetical protein